MLLSRLFHLRAMLLLMIVFNSYMFCAFIIYYVFQYKCAYPTLKHYSDRVDPVYAMVIADTHLTGTQGGHWFEKWRREKQMRESFKAAMRLHKPEIVFVLGDLFDEGKWCSDAEFNEHVEKFKFIFHVPEQTKLYAVVGNHDIGLHYSTTEHLNKRFESNFLMPPVQLLSIRDNHFVLINSIAMEGDGCTLCAEAEKEIDRIADILRCTSGSALCKGKDKLDRYSRPIIMQHYPLYRESDSVCSERESAPERERHNKFRERWECLSREATDHLVEALSPRAAFGAHTHHACLLKHTFQPTHHHKMEFHEYTVPSFSHGITKEPMYYLLTITPDEVKTYKCAMPTDSDIKTGVVALMAVQAILIILYMVRTRHGKRFYKRA